MFPQASRSVFTGQGWIYAPVLQSLGGGSRLTVKGCGAAGVWPTPGKRAVPLWDAGLCEAALVSSHSGRGSESGQRCPVIRPKAQGLLK